MLVSALAVELTERLAGAKLRALWLDPGGRSVALYLKEGTLVVRVRPEETGVTLQGPSEPTPAARPFAAVVDVVDALPDDRVLRVHLRRARGRKVGHRIVIELLTNQWNVVVTEGEEGRIRHVLVRREGERTLRPGSLYHPPPPSTREGVDGALTVERWREILLPLSAARRRGALLTNVAWTSALNARALLGAAASEEGDLAERALAEGHALWLRLVASAHAPEPEPVLLRREGFLQPYPLPLPGDAWESAPGLLEAFRAAEVSTGREGEEILPAAWLAALESHASRLLRKAEKLERELLTAPDPAALRALGDLLLARFREVPRGAERVELVGFGGESVSLALDPAQGPSENAAAYYERAARAERARHRLPALIQEARREADNVEALLARARAGDARAEEIEAALPAAPEGAPPGDQAPTLPYRAYRSSGGIEIRVGRGAKRNDELTFQHARPDDVWMHARHAAGAHVVLRWEGEGNPPARDLTEAASLAALHSRARGAGTVPVDWTRRKYVRKPRKAPPGSVTLERAQTIFVAPDPELEERLREG